MSPDKQNLHTGLTNVFNNFNMDVDVEKPQPGTPDTLLDEDEDEDEIDMDMDCKDLHHKIKELQNEKDKLQYEKSELQYKIKGLEQYKKNMDEIYKNVPEPPTEIADRNGNVLYTRCPFNTHNNEQLYSDGKGTITLTPMQSKFINSLYVLCPLTTKHPKNAPVFDEHGKIVKGEELFKDSPNKSRKRKSSSPKKTPSPRKTQKKSPSPRKSPKNHQKRQKH